MDQQLIELSKVAEQGKACPPVRLLLGAGVVAGTPAPAQAFSDAMFEVVRDEAWHALVGPAPAARKAAKNEEQFISAIEPIEGTMRAVSTTAPPSPESVLTLLGVQVWAAAGNTFTLPALRVPIAQVNAWWMAGNKDTSSGGGWSFFVGGIVPLDE